MEINFDNSNADDVKPNKTRPRIKFVIHLKLIKFKNVCHY